MPTPPRTGATGNAVAPKVGFVSLGCPKALVDSEQVLTRLKAEGYATVGDYGEADLVIVNTCGFIDDAVNESLDAIGEALAENGRVIVTGCLGAREDGAFVRTLHPKVLAVTGPHAPNEVMDAVHAHLPRAHQPFVDLVPDHGVKLTPKHYAYLKISEGCNHRCSFCIIPSMRGDLVSRPIGEVVREAESLVKSGVRELLVISQDTSAYGVDLKYRTDFIGGRPTRTRMTELAHALGELGAWVRLHYVYPYPSVDEVLPLMAETSLSSGRRVLPYLDVPFQHASPRILKLMKRPASGEKNIERIRAWRAVCPELTIRSTFIVGFPGETEAEFEELLDFLVEAQLDRVGCFAYSPVAGATANDLPGALPEELKEERRARFMEVQAQISESRLRARIGRSIEVIVDDVQDNIAVARSWADAPEIDGLVHIQDGGALSAGDIVTVRVVETTEHDLIAVTGGVGSH
jgi:ribosomal protein S12 methylthiotransferase